MAIDYGTKRVGIAVTDPAGLIASGLTTVHAEEAVFFLENYFSREEVDIIVVGEPKSLKNTTTQGSAYAAGFVKKLKKKFPGKKIDRMDERFTSKMAFRVMIEGGLKKKQRQNKKLVDEISAAILLQDYLEYINRDRR